MVNLALVGPQEAGVWVLVFAEHARRVLDAEEARQIDLALDAVEASFSGETDFERFFPGLPSSPGQGKRQ